MKFPCKLLCMEPSVPVKLLSLHVDMVLNTWPVTEHRCLTFGCCPEKLCVLRLWASSLAEIWWTKYRSRRIGWLWVKITRSDESKYQCGKGPWWWQQSWLNTTHCLLDYISSWIDIHILSLSPAFVTLRKYYMYEKSCRYFSTFLDFVIFLWMNTKRTKCNFFNLKFRRILLILLWWLSEPAAAGSS